MAVPAPIGPNGYPIVRDVELIPILRLPDSLRQIFPFKLFNIMQSKCFPAIFQSSDNFVLSSPTGSGKTVILELAICHLIANTQNKNFKIIYQAPIKALCSERYQDWRAKFNPLGLNVAELTGDSENSHLRDVQTAHIIITTPEKWDSITRKWKDNRRLVELVKLFLIDEVHLVREDRGANLEAVVSRMKSVGSDIRFIALSATVPNPEDIASWLGKNCLKKHIPACKEIFDETYRPVKLERHVYGYNSNSVNDFQFEQVCNKNLFGVIAKHTIGRPLLIFCTTRKSCETTAHDLAQWWRNSNSDQRLWDEPARQFSMADNGLQSDLAYLSLSLLVLTLVECVSAGVAFHHAGLDHQDRKLVQQSYIDGNIGVICCTSTLAVGINLPAHFVIIKNTVTWQQDVGSKELSDSEIMQMLGRAGRPQYDRTAVAVIMTRAEKAKHYEKMVSGGEILESRLHLNLIEHLNSEIGLGTIHDTFSATKWLEGTFLWVRLNKNPGHYRIEGDEPYQSPEDRARRICGEALEALSNYDLINNNGKIRCTERGEAMTRYYVQFETMKLFSGLQPKARMSELLSAIAQAAEFKGIRLRGDQKCLYKEINQSPLLKWRIPVDIALPGHKISLLIQATLGGIDLSHDPRFKTQMNQLNMECNQIFQHASRLARCIIDCEVSSGDSITVRNAMELSRSLGARAWDDSPLQLGQLQGIGPVAVRKFASADIKSIEDLETTEPHRIEMILSRNPPLGRDIHSHLARFPKPRITLCVVGEPRKSVGEKGVDVDVDANIGFLNDDPPKEFKGKTIMLCLLAETSDGRVLHYYRASAIKIGQGEHVSFHATMTSSTQVINCYVSCEDIAGTLQYASLTPKIPGSMFKGGRAKGEEQHKTTLEKSRQASALQKTEPCDEFADNDLDDRDMLQALSSSDFQDIDTFGLAQDQGHKKPGPKPKPADWQPTKLSNGRWACNHSCKNKDACRHLCCNEGLEKMPAKPRSQKKAELAQTSIPTMKGFAKQTKATFQSSDIASVEDDLTISKENAMTPLTNLDHGCILDEEMMEDSPSEDRGTRRSENSRMPIEELDLTSDELDGPICLKHTLSDNDFVPAKKIRGESCFKMQTTPHNITTVQHVQTRTAPNDHDSEGYFLSDDLLEETAYQESESSSQLNRESEHGLGRLYDEIVDVETSPSSALQIVEQADSSFHLPSVEASGINIGAAQSALVAADGEAKPADWDELKEWARDFFGDIVEISNS